MNLVTNVRVGILGTRGFPSTYGGFETAVGKIAPYLLRHNLKVFVFCRKSSGVMRIETNNDDIKQIFTWGINSKNLSTLTHGFTSMLWCLFHKVDTLIIMNIANGYFIPFLKFFGIKTIVNVDGLEWERAKWSSTGKKIFFIGAKITSRFADEIICDSEEIANYWKKVFHRDSTYIPYGAETNFPETEKFYEFQDRKYILYLARLVPENSISDFLDAILLIPSDITIVIIGDGQDPMINEKLHGIARSHENVLILGHVDNLEILHSIWSRAYVYFHGHTVGGTNPTLVQSLYYNLKIVAVKTAFNLEVARENALYCESNPHDIASKLILSFRSPVKPAISLPEKYKWEEVSEKYLKLIEKVSKRI